MIGNAWSWALGSLILTLAYFWEVSDDDRGDLNKRRDVLVRGSIMIVTSALNAAMNGKRLAMAVGLFFISFNAAFAWFFMFFDYTIAAIMIRNDIFETVKGGNWFNHKGKSSDFDKASAWVRVGPYWRLAFRFVYFVISIALYVWFAIQD